MPSIRLHPPTSLHPSKRPITTPTPTPLPPLLSTPLGLAILEIQGTLNVPSLNHPTSTSPSDTSSTPPDFPIGTLDFPLLPTSSPSVPNTDSATKDPKTASQPSKHKRADPDAEDASAGAEEGPWMKKVHLHIRGNQRLVGEVRRLARPVGVLGRRRRGGSPRGDGGGMSDGDRNGDGDDEVEVLEVVRWKLFFGGRPEFV